MTCDECKLVQAKGMDPWALVTYVRVGDSNVAVIGCRAHVKTLLERYNRGMVAIEKAL